MNNPTIYSKRLSHIAAQGFSLVELLVSVAIGLLVLAAVTSLLVSQKNTYRTQDDSSRVQENGRLLMQVLTHDFRIVSHPSFASGVPAATFAGITTLPTTGTFSGSPPALSALNDTGLNNSDEFSLSFYGEDKSTPGQSDNSIMDCQGNVAKSADLVTERFYVALDNVGAGASNEPSLFCEVIAGPMGPLPGKVVITGVESMQALYQEDLSGNMSKFRFVSANVVGSMDQVKAALISVVLRGPGGGNSQGQTVFNHFGTQYAPGNTAPSGDSGSVFTVPTASSNDGKLRKQYTFLVGIRNRL